MSDSSSSTTELRDARRLPVVAIVGRANVGKSTLFNRLLRRRRTITDSVPGVTRDPVAVECHLGERQLTLVDTGGFRVEASGIEAMASRRALSLVEEADLVLLVMDVNEVTAEDDRFIEIMRPLSDRVLLVVNKIDGPEREAQVWNFHSYGFREVVGVSAEHRRNIDELIDHIERRLPEGAPEPTAEEEQERATVHLAILGKPNTGKSTLMNILIGHDESIVSDEPGTTRDVIEGQFAYRSHRFRLVDTAGIRRKNRITEDLEYYSVHKAISTIELSDIVLLVIDAEIGVTEQDKKIAALAIEKGKGVILVLNKWDLLEPVANLRAAQEDRARFVFPVLEFAPLVPLSALRGEGIDELKRTLLKVWRQLNMRVSTGKMNKALEAWNQHYAPPGDRRTSYRVRYLTQASRNPVKFLLFVNRKHGFPATWVQYLTNRIRKDFGFSSVPLAVELRER